MKRHPVLTLFSAAVVLTACRPDFDDEMAASGDTEMDPGGTTGGETATDGIGEDDGSTTSGSTTGLDDTTTAGDDDNMPPDVPPACDAETHDCVDLAPAEWEGPALLVERENADEPACTAVYQDLMLTLHDDLVAPEPACDCGCVTNEGNCSNAIEAIPYPIEPGIPYEQNMYGCLVGATPVVLASGALQDYDTDMGVRFRFDSPEVVGGGCSPTESHLVDPAGFDRHFDLCSADEFDATACADGGLCLPRPSTGRMCVWAEGDQECPADGPYVDRIVHYRDFADDRACTACGCEIEQSCADSYVNVWHGFGDVEPFPADGSCQSTSNVTALNYVAELDASCTPTSSEPMGSASPIDPVTVCCTEA